MVRELSLGLLRLRDRPMMQWEFLLVLVARQLCRQLVQMSLRGPTPGSISSGGLLGRYTMHRRHVVPRFLEG
jgi:hypothetical protein